MTKNLNNKEKNNKNNNNNKYQCGKDYQVSIASIAKNNWKKTLKNN